MIELPSDLAEVLKVVQSNEHGSGILFPNANEELLAELADAWEAWNNAAEPAVRTIVASANRAMANMSGTAADSFEGYLRKYAGTDQSHAVTTLDAGVAMARSLRGAHQAVTQTKTEMVRELQYAKDYMEQNPAGKHDDIAQSEGIKTAADTYNTYVGQVGSSVDTMLRQSAGHVERMTSAGQVASLGGSGGAGSGTGATRPTATTALDASTLQHPTTGLDSLTPTGGVPNGAGGAGMPGDVGMSGGPDGGSGSAYKPQLSSLQPFQAPSPVGRTVPGAGLGTGGAGVGGGGGGGGAGMPVFKPSSSPGLGLAGMPGYTGGGAGGSTYSPSGLSPWSGSGTGSSGLGGSGAGGAFGGGSPFGGLGGLGGGSGLGEAPGPAPPGTAA